VQKLIALFQMTYTGAPMLYYGTESGVWGGQDPDDRSPMNWQDIRFDAQAGTHSPAYIRPADDMNFDSSLAGFYKEYIGFRNNSQMRFSSSADRLTYALDRASFMSVDSRVFGYYFAYNALNDAFVGFNLSSDTVSMTVPVRCFCAAYKANYFSTAPFSFELTQRSGSSFTLKIPPQSGALVKLLTQVGVKDQLDNSAMSARAYPQPFTDETTLEYTLAAAGEVSMSVADVLGREVLRIDEGWKPQGTHTTTLRGERLQRGTYFCTLRVSGGAVKRLLLMRQ
jgi:hypothetical protein